MEWFDFARYVTIATTIYYLAVVLFFYQSEIRQLLFFRQAEKLHNINPAPREQELRLSPNNTERKTFGENSLDDFMPALYQLLETCQHQSADKTTILRRTRDLLSVYKIDGQHPLYETVISAIVDAIEVRLSIRLTDDDIKKIYSCASVERGE